MEPETATIRLGKLFFVFVVFVCLLGCGESMENFSVSAPELLRMIREDASIVRKLDLSSVDTQPYIRDHPGAAYYFACGLLDLGIDREADILLEKTFQYDSGPWRREAGRELAARMKAGAGLMRIARRYEQLYPGDVRSRLIMMKALHASGAYPELLQLTEDFTARLSREADPRVVSEALLYRARAEAGVRHPRFPETIRKLFYSCPASAIHQEAWNDFFTPGTSDTLDSSNTVDTLDKSDKDGKFFSRDERDFFRAKTRVAAGEWAAALTAYKTRSSFSAGDPAFLREYAEVLHRALGWRKSIEELTRIAPGLQGDSRLVCEEYLGKLYRTGGQYDKSVSALQHALEALGNRKNIFPVSENEETQKDRIIWYLLSSTLRGSPQKMMAALPSYLSSIEDPGYFFDLFESLASTLVRGRDWKSLASLWTLLRDRGGYERERARVAFLTACALRAGLYSSPPGNLPEARELFEYAFANADPYYRILAGLILKKDAPVPQSAGMEFIFPSPQEKTLTAPSASSAPSALTDSEEDAYVRGFLDFGLNTRAAQAARRMQRSVSARTLLLVAEREAAEGRYIDTLRLLQRASRRPGLVPDRRMLEALYPQAFAGEMHSVIEDTDIPPAVFYGLVREESYFDPHIGSHAGAVGLAQLMPATANEVALKLKIPSPRLTDPLTNLRLGSYYLQAQWKRFGDGASALAAYNAGTNRSARWRTQLSGLPGILFAEALSLSETREYIRKVLVSAVHYGYLYYEQTPRQTVREIFKDFS